VFSEQVVIFTLATMTGFAVLQSRVHEAWVRLLSSTMGEGLRYSATDCFDTFPFPVADPRRRIAALDAVGGRLDEARARYMIEEDVGLTTTYNRLKDPDCRETRVVELRALHEEMDRAVIGAYADGDAEGRWLEVVVPPFCPMNDDEKKRLEAFEDGVIDRLFALNAKRANEERKGVEKGGGKRKAAKVAPGAGSKNARKGKMADGQLALGGDEET
jgi:hypothetical protein